MSPAAGRPRRGRRPANRRLPSRLADTRRRGCPDHRRAGEEPRTFQAGAREIEAVEAHAFEVAIHQPVALQRSSRQRAAPQDTVRQVGLVKIGAAEVRFLEHGALESGALSMAAASSSDADRLPKNWRRRGSHCRILRGPNWPRRKMRGSHERWTGRPRKGRHRKPGSR